MARIETVPVDKIRESPFNRRRTWSLDEITASIREHGIIQKPLARPVNGHDERELVFGHRRFRGGVAAGLASIELEVRDLSDKEALELIAVENVQRADMHPLDEAELYREWHVAQKTPLEEIAAKIGKGLGYVRQRLKLLDLGEPAKKAFLAGQLSASLALLVARVPAKLQGDAVKELLPSDHRGSPTLKQASEAVQRRFMLRLDTAPFDRADEKLVAGAGGCGACPKRTGNQPELFADVQSKDLCTDPACFEQKRDAGWAKRTAYALEKGQKVLSDKQAKRIFPHGDRVCGEEYVDLDDTSFEAGNKKWRTVLGKGVTPVLARDPSGGVHELVPKAEARRALKIKAPKGVRAGSGASQQDAARQKKAKARRAVRDLALERLVVKAVTSLPPAGWMRELALALIGLSSHEAITDMMKRREIDVDKTHRASASLGKFADTLGEGPLRGLIVELAAYSHVSPYSLELGDRLKGFAKLYGVDLKKVEKDAAEAAAAKKAPKGKAGKRVADAPRVEGVCRVCRCTEEHACDTPDGPCSWVEPDLCSACEDVPPKKPAKKKGGRK